MVFAGTLLECRIKEGESMVERVQHVQRCSRRPFQIDICRFKLHTVGLDLFLWGNSLTHCNP